MHDDDEPTPKPRRLTELRLDPLAVAELESYIVELRAEIARTEAEIGRKRSHRSAADAFSSWGETKRGPANRPPPVP